MLGDDVLLGDIALAHKYKEAILALGVTFSPTKTFESELFAEFAKRIFYKGVEVTPFPISAVIGEKKFYELLPVFYNEIGKGWNFSEGVHEAIRSYYNFVKGFNASYCKEIGLKAAVAEKLMLYMRGASTAIDCIKSVYRWKGQPDVKVVKESICKDAIQGCLLDLFVASDPASNKTGPRAKEPLGQLAENMVMFYTSSEDEMIVIWACEHISSIPILNVYGQITEMYIKLKKTAQGSIKDLEV